MAEENIDKEKTSENNLSFRTWKADEPHKFDDFWKSCRKGHDRYGNLLWNVGTYWVSRDSMRFLSFAKIYDRNKIVIVFIASTGRFMEQRCGDSIGKAYHHWKRRIETGWYAFVDPETQEIYP